MLVFAAFAPHPLISIPEIGQEQASRLRRTLHSYDELAYELHAAKPDTIVIISPHNEEITDAFTINQRPQIVVTFKKFGDLSDGLIFKNDLGLGYQIKESTETSSPVVLTDTREVDYGIGVPLYHMTRYLHLQKTHVIPIGSSSLTLQTHYDFGSIINQHIHKVTKRVAVIASGDLSHGATKGTAGSIPYNVKAAAFNEHLNKALKNSDVQSLLSITSEQLQSIYECGLRPLVMLMGILDQRQYTPEVLSFESTLGIGYTVARFDFH